MNRLCKKHGGNYEGFDTFWYCDTCAREGIDLCKCGGHARFFAEAMMQSVTCESCKDWVMVVGKVDIRAEWNKGTRGFIDTGS